MQIDLIPQRASWLVEKLTVVDSHVEIVLLTCWLAILKEMWLKPPIHLF